MRGDSETFAGRGEKSDPRHVTCIPEWIGRVFPIRLRLVRPALLRLRRLHFLRAQMATALTAEPAERSSSVDDISARFPGRRKDRGLGRFRPVGFRAETSRGDGENQPRRGLPDDAPDQNDQTVDHPENQQQDQPDQESVNPPIARDSRQQGSGAVRSPSARHGDIVAERGLTSQTCSAKSILMIDLWAYLNHLPKGTQKPH